MSNPVQPRAVVQMSGGIDSTVLTALAIEQYGRENVYPIACDSDSVFWRDRDRIAVKRVATNFGIQHHLFECRIPQLDMMEYTTDDTYQDVGFIPGWKMLLNTASLAWAQKIGAAEVWIGNILTENEFPDEDGTLIAKLDDLYNEIYTTGEGMRGVHIVEPYKEMQFTKPDVIRKGYEMGVNIWDTVSCGDERMAGGFNCGVCPWCKKRRAAFQIAGVPDKTRYLFDPNAQVDDWQEWKDLKATMTRAAQGIQK